MRFHADGPDIPLELLEARDRGEVIFLCGAGVSIPAGLPSFAELARLVVSDLGVPVDGVARQLLDHATGDHLAPVPLDQVFDQLTDDYGAARVEAAVARRLRPRRAADLSLHRIVRRLSADEQGQARLVTTNFDPLFDRLPGRRPKYVPPHLPELGFGGAFQGVVYLHGRVDNRAAREGSRQGLVLSATDFGRAYLAQGWATRFMRQLLDQFTLVLLGYSADDAPVRYLLQGLRDDRVREGALYAFAAGEPAALDAKWRARGVQAIAYEPEDAAHSNLWRSLASWATRAEDPTGWQNQLLGAAAAGPSAVEPFVRGQVAALVQSVGGARVWAEAAPPPPAEWLCVLDNRLRFARVQRPWAEPSSDAFDPLAAYGLDADPPRPSVQLRDAPTPGVNFLAPTARDRRDAPPAGLVSIGLPIEPLPPRLFQLGRWMGRVAADPITLWWAAGQPGLHPLLIDQLERATEQEAEGLSAERREAWRLLLEGYAGASDPRRHAWYELERDVRRRGWTEGALRQLAVAIQPRLVSRRPTGSSPRPPDAASDVRALVEFEVQFLDVRNPDQRIADEILAPAAAHWRMALSTGASLLRDLRPRFWRSPSLFPADDPAGSRAERDRSGFIRAFVRLLERRAAIDPLAARREIGAWPMAEPYIFDPLRIWAAHRADLFAPEAAADVLEGLGDAAFWNERGARDLLMTLRARWSGFSPEVRQRLEVRILAGPQAWSGEGPGSHARRAAIAAATRLGWLQSEGCELSGAAAAALPALRAADPRWRPEWDRSAADSHESRAGWVETVTDPADLENLPPGQVAARALAASAERIEAFVKADPFQGLVERYPARALASLAFEARAGNHPVRLWATMIERKEALPPRLLALLAHRLARLPAAILVELRYSAARWLDGNIVALGGMDADLAWSVWDAVFDGILSGGELGTESGLGEIMIGGIAVSRSRRTFEHALNGPIGELTHAALEVTAEPDAGGMPVEVKARLRLAMQAPGEGGDNAVSIVFSRLPGIFHVDRAFADELIPMLDPMGPQSEPAWSGYLAGQNVGGPELFTRVRNDFPAVFRSAAEWHWTDSPYSELAGFLVAILFTPGWQHFMSLAQARTALQSGGEPACRRFAEALWQQAAPTTWPTLRRLLTRVWPLEAASQSEETASRLIDLALAVGDNFPEAVRIIRPSLRPVAALDLPVHRLSEGDEGDGPGLAERFPADTLALLEAVVMPTQPVYNLAALLESMAGADPSIRQTPAWRRLNDIALR